MSAATESSLLICPGCRKTARAARHVVSPGAIGACIRLETARRQLQDAGDRRNTQACDEAEERLQRAEEDFAAFLQAPEGGVPAPYLRVGHSRSLAELLAGLDSLKQVLVDMRRDEGEIPALGPATRATADLLYAVRSFSDRISMGLGNLGPVLAAYEGWKAGHTPLNGLVVIAKACLESDQIDQGGS